MIRLLKSWLTFRHIEGHDIDLAAVGDRAFLLIHTRRRFRPVIELEVDRDELLVLADMIRDYADDRDVTS